MNSFVVFTIVLGLAAYANALNDTNSTESGNSSSNATLDTVAIPESVHSNQMASSQKMDHHGASADNDHNSSSVTSGGSSSGSNNSSSSGSMSGGNPNSASGSSASDTQGLSQTTEGTNTATTILGLHLSVASFLLAFYIA